jgi:hypothetical protein
VLHLPESPALQTVVLSCTNRDPKTLSFLLHSLSMFAVEIKIEGESVYAVYLAGSNFTMESTIQKLEETLRSGLEDNYGIIYAERVYPFPNHANATLINAIVNKIKPSLTSLLLGPQLKWRKPA